MTSLSVPGADRLNPILLKEVRAALRGRWFKSTFAIVLSLALVASLLVLMFTGDGEEARGPAYFTAVAGCMAFGIHGLVPFAAMLSMTAESDENTLELLQLSGISGWRIVLGKLGSAMLQMLLIMSAFAPFLTMAFLMRGVALSTILLTLAASASFCAAQCAVGLMLGSIARARWARIVLLLVFAFLLVQFSPLGIVFAMFLGAGMMGLAGGGAVGPGVTGPGIVWLLVCLTTVCVSMSIAAGRLAHPEDNQSTPMRATTTLLVLAGIGVAAFASTLFEVTRTLAITLLCVSPLFLFLVTERERLPRAVAAHLPRWSRVFPLAAWLPGGGRGVLFVLVHLALLLGAHAVIGSVILAPSTYARSGLVLMTGLALNALLFLVLPSTVMARMTPTLAGRSIVRVVMVLFFAAANLAPALLAFLSRRNLEEWAPLVAAFQSGQGEVSFTGPWILLAVLGVVSLVISVPRIAQSLREVSAAARRRPRTEVQPDAAPVA